MRESMDDHPQVGLEGTGFKSGAQVLLRKTGSKDITAKNVVIVSFTQITCNLPLSKAAYGVYDVYVKNRDGQTATLPAGFTIYSQRETGTLKVNSVPNKATVFFDGKAIGLTNLNMMVPLGSHPIVVSKAGYNDYTPSVNLKDSPKNVTVTAPLTKI